MEKANLTLYTVIGDFSRVAESMRVRFQDVTKMFTPEDDRWMILLQDDTMIRCSMMESGSQADQVAEHTEGMVNYFVRVDTPLTAIKEEVIRQIQCFNCIVGIEFELDDDRDRTSYIINTFYDVAGDVNGFLLYPSMSLFDSKGNTSRLVQLEDKGVKVRDVRAIAGEFRLVRGGTSGCGRRGSSSSGAFFRTFERGGSALYGTFTL